MEEEESRKIFPFPTFFSELLVPLSDILVTGICGVFPMISMFNVKLKKLISLYPSVAIYFLFFEIHYRSS